jgi:hypothetical protein
MTKLKPCNIITTTADVEAATEILADSKNYIVRYLRHSPTVGVANIPARNTDGAVLTDGPTKRQRVICQGVPFACMIAFVYQGRLCIGWSKRIEEPKGGRNPQYGNGFLHDLMTLSMNAMTAFLNCEEEPESELPYSKSEGRLVAVIRGLKDNISFDGKQAFSTHSGPIPSDLAKNLPQFIEYVERVFDSGAYNILGLETKSKESAAATA